MKVYKLGEAAKKLGISPRTLQNLDKKNIIKAQRTITNRRFYTEEELNKYYNGKEAGK